MVLKQSNFGENVQKSHRTSHFSTKSSPKGLKIRPLKWPGCYGNPIWPMGLRPIGPSPRPVAVKAHGKKQGLLPGFRNELLRSSNFVTKIQEVVPYKAWAKRSLAHALGHWPFGPVAVVRASGQRPLARAP